MTRTLSWMVLFVLLAACGEAAEAFDDESDAMGEASAEHANTPGDEADEEELGALSQPLVRADPTDIGAGTTAPRFGCSGSDCYCYGDTDCILPVEPNYCRGPLECDLHH